MFNVPSWMCTRKNCPSVEVLKTRSLLIKLSPQTRGPKNYSRPRVLTFYFYVRFRAATVVVDRGGIFGIWRVGEEIWVRFFWAKGKRVIFFVEGGGGGGGVLRVLIGGSELEWEMRRTRWGDRRGALCTGFTLVWLMKELLGIYFCTYIY